MKQLTGRMHDIAAGRTDLSATKVERYRRSFADKGYTLPPLDEPGRPVRRVRPKPKPLPGTALAQSLTWFVDLESTNPTCSCKTLAEEMDRRGVEWTLKNTEDIARQMLKNSKALRESITGLSIGGVLLTAVAIVPDGLLLLGAQTLIRRACDTAKTEAAKPVRRPKPVPRKRRGFGAAFKMRPGVKPEFVTAAQFQTDIQRLVASLPHDITAIAGVARSGLSAATMVSMYLHLPLIAIRQTSNDLVDVGNGWRLGDKRHVDPKRDKVAVIDDTVMTGNSLSAISALIAKEFGDHVTAAVYVNPEALTKPDIHARDLSWPHLLEWNLFNSVLSPNLALDFDGILCHDPTLKQDDDGPMYRAFIDNAKPLYLPRKERVPIIITARIEKYREPTMAWLKRHKVKVGRLVMHPAKTLAERRRRDIPRWKAEQFATWANQHKVSVPPLAYVESDDAQANLIAKHSRRMVICPATGRVY